MEQEIIKAGATVLGKAYDDVAHPSAKSLGNNNQLDTSDCWGLVTRVGALGH